MDIESGNLRKILSTNIKKRRKILGLSQEKLAEAAELSAQTINDIEGCRMWVSDKTIARLCQALHVEAYQLLLPLLDEDKGKDTAAATPSDVLLNVQQQLKKNIDVQFEELFKSGIF
jgi:transcriptional regulator with XRE-family HTH domain